MKNFRKGFTLLEILLVVGIIAILAGIVIVAINPSKQLATVRNTERKSDIKTIYNAINQYYIDNSRYPASLTSVLTEVCDTDTATSSHNINCTGMVDLSELVPKYLTAIPKDPKGPVTAFLNKIINTVYAATGGTGYYVMKDSTNKVVLNTEQAELGVVIAIGTTTGMVVEEEVVVTPILYWKNVGNDNSWNNVNNWFTDAEATTQAAGVPWTGAGLYFDYDLALATGETSQLMIDASIDPNQVGITGACDISSLYTSGFGDISIYSGTFNGDYFSLQSATIFGGTFSGDSSENSRGFIRGGTFSGDNFSNYNDSYIYDGNFTGTGFTNSGLIEDGTFSGSNFLNQNVIYDGAFSGTTFTNNGNITTGTFNYGTYISSPGSYIYGGDWSGGDLTVYDSDFQWQDPGEPLVADGITITIDSSCANYLTPSVGISTSNGGSIVLPLAACELSGDATDPDCWSDDNITGGYVIWGPTGTIIGTSGDTDGSVSQGKWLAVGGDDVSYPAFHACYNLEEDGYPKGTWYLPSIQQLAGAYNASVPSFQSDGYWSATEYPDLPEDGALKFDMGTGPESAYYKDGTYGSFLVRCLR